MEGFHVLHLICGSRLLLLGLTEDGRRLVMVVGALPALAAGIQRLVMVAAGRRTVAERRMVVAEARTVAEVVHTAVVVAVDMGGKTALVLFRRR